MNTWGWATISIALWVAAFTGVAALFAPPKMARTPPPSQTNGRPAMPSLADLWVWQAYADDSVDHRSPTEPDVFRILDIIHADRHFAEIALLIEEGRDLRPPWQAADL
jgi:hypothetical protein